MSRRQSLGKDASRIVFIKLALSYGLSLASTPSFCWASGSVVGGSWWLPPMHSPELGDFKVRPDDLRRMGINPDDLQLVAGHIASTSDGPGGNPFWQSLFGWLWGESQNGMGVKEPEPENDEGMVQTEPLIPNGETPNNKCSISLSQGSGYLASPDVGLEELISLVPKNCDIVLQSGTFRINGRVTFKSGQRLKGVVSTNWNSLPTNPLLPTGFGLVAAAQPEPNSNNSSELMALVVSGVDSQPGHMVPVPVVEIATGFASAAMLQMAEDTEIIDVAFNLLGLPVREGLSCHQPVTTRSTAIRMEGVLLLNGTPCDESMLNEVVTFGLDNIGSMPQPRSAMFKNPAGNTYQDRKPSGNDQGQPRRNRERDQPPGRMNNGRGFGNGGGGDRNPRQNRPPRDRLTFVQILNEASLVNSLILYLQTAPNIATALAHIAGCLDHLFPEQARLFRRVLTPMIPTRRNTTGLSAQELVSDMQAHHWDHFARSGGIEALIHQVFGGISANRHQQFVLGFSWYFYLRISVHIDWYNSRGDFIGTSQEISTRRRGNYHPDDSLLAHRDTDSEATTDEEHAKRDAISRLFNKIKSRSDPEKWLRLILSQAVGGNPENYNDEVYWFNHDPDYFQRFSQLMMTSFSDVDVSEINALLIQFYTRRIEALHDQIRRLADPWSVLLRLFRLTQGRELAHERYDYLQRLLREPDQFMNTIRDGFIHGRINTVSSLERLLQPQQSAPAEFDELPLPEEPVSVDVGRFPPLVEDWYDRSERDGRQQQGGQGRVPRQPIPENRLHSRETLLEHESELQEYRREPPGLLVPPSTAAGHLRSDSNPAIMNHQIVQCPASVQVQTNPQAGRRLFPQQPSGNQLNRQPGNRQPSENDIHRVETAVALHRRGDSVPAAMGNGIHQCPVETVIVNGQSGAVSLVAGSGPIAQRQREQVFRGNRYGNGQPVAGRYAGMHQSEADLNTLERRRRNQPQVVVIGRSDGAQVVSCEQLGTRGNRQQAMVQTPPVIWSPNQDPGVMSPMGQGGVLGAGAPPQHSQSAEHLLGHGGTRQGNFFHGHSGHIQVRVVEPDIDDDIDPLPAYSPPRSPNPNFRGVGSTPFMNAIGVSMPATGFSRGTVERSSLPVTSRDRTMVDAARQFQRVDVGTIDRRLLQANRARRVPFVWLAGSRNRYMSNWRRGLTSIRGLLQRNYDVQRRVEMAHRNHLDRRVEGCVHFQHLVDVLSSYFAQADGWASLAQSLSLMLTSPVQVNSFIEAVRIASQYEVTPRSELPFSEVVDVPVSSDLLIWVVHQMAIRPLGGRSQLAVEVVLARALLDILDDNQIGDLIQILQQGSGYRDGTLEYDV